MAIQVVGSSGANIDADTTFKAMRTTQRPLECLAWGTAGGISGALTGVAANGNVFSFRYTDSNLCIIKSLRVGYITTTAFTTAQGVDFAAYVARSFSASDTGGTAISITGNNTKHRTSLATLSTNDCRISSTAALTAGTRTLDTNPVGIACGSSTAIGTSMPVTEMLFRDGEDYPIVLTNNEGIVIQMPTAMGAAGVIKLYALVEYIEVSAY